MPNTASGKYPQRGAVDPSEDPLVLRLTHGTLSTWNYLISERFRRFLIRAKLPFDPLRLRSQRRSNGAVAREGTAMSLWHMRYVQG